VLCPQGLRCEGTSPRPGIYIAPRKQACDHPARQSQDASGLGVAETHADRPASNSARAASGALSLVQAAVEGGRSSICCRPRVKLLDCLQRPPHGFVLGIFRDEESDCPRGASIPTTRKSDAVAVQGQGAHRANSSRRGQDCQTPPAGGARGAGSCSHRRRCDGALLHGQTRSSSRFRRTVSSPSHGRRCDGALFHTRRW